MEKYFHSYLYNFFSPGPIRLIVLINNFSLKPFSMKPLAWFAWNWKCRCVVLLSTPEGGVLLILSILGKIVDKWTTQWILYLLQGHIFMVILVRLASSKSYLLKLFLTCPYENILVLNDWTSVSAALLLIINLSVKHSKIKVTRSLSRFIQDQPLH